MAQLSDDAFVSTLLTTTLNLATMVNQVYRSNELEIQSVTFNEIQSREFQKPLFETIRKSGTNEQTSPMPSRHQYTETTSRQGRLHWIDVSMKASVTAIIQDSSVALESVSGTDLISDLGNPATFEDLQTALATRYTEGVANTILRKLRVETLEDFTSNSHLLLNITGGTPAVFDPADPTNSRALELPLGFLAWPDDNISEALRMAKLCREIMIHERNYAKNLQGFEITQPSALVVCFPFDAVTNTTMPGLTAAEARTSTQTFFDAESMTAHFVATP